MAIRCKTSMCTAWGRGRIWSVKQWINDCMLTNISIVNRTILWLEMPWCWFNTLRPRQNGRRIADDVFKCIFLNENVWIKISLKFISKVPVNNIPALVRVMAWRRSGDKSLSEPMMVRLPTHICVTRPQWVNCNKDVFLILLGADVLFVYIH